MVEERSAGAVVVRETEQGRRYLLLRYRGGHWGLVKGHIEEGESLEETIRREATEETGLEDLSFVEGFEQRTSYVFHREDERVDKTVVYLLATTETRDVEVGSPVEHDEIGWFEDEKALEQVTYDDTRAVLEAARGHLDERAQTQLEDWG